MNENDSIGLKTCFIAFCLIYLRPITNKISTKKKKVYINAKTF